MRLKRVLLISTLLLITLFACSRDSEDILAFQSFLKKQVHTKIYASLKNSIDLLKLGYDNVVTEAQLIPLRRSTRIYLKFLDKFEPQFDSTRKMQFNLQTPLQDYDEELGQIALRIEEYRQVKHQIDSLSTATDKALLTRLDQKEQLLHRKITNQYLIKQTNQLLNEINQQLAEIYEK